MNKGERISMKNTKPEKNDINDFVCYKDRFLTNEQVNVYEEQEYGWGSYSSFIWKIQQPLLRDILQHFCRRINRPIRLLDFACGTGRVTSFMEQFVADIVGVDISPAMVDVARKKTIKTKFVVGDILCDYSLLQPPYDVIITFRFLLNAEDDIRRKVLYRLRELIAIDGLLILNVHGNLNSVRHPVIIWKRWRQSRGKINYNMDIMLNEMSSSETKQLLSETGFEIIEQRGFGILPGLLYRTPLHFIASVIDRFAAGKNWSKNWSIDLVFVCRPKNV
jgi:SAM-dependent methyltransferase